MIGIENEGTPLLGGVKTVPLPLAKAHRILAPRIAYVIGSRAKDGTPTLAPMSNVTQVSSDPQLFVLAAGDQSNSLHNIRETGAFSISIPTVTQAKDVWLLGDKYSGYTAEVGGTSKMDAVRSEVEVFPDSDVPILRGCIAWCYCEVEFEVEGLAGDHGVFIASVKRAIGDATVMQTDGDYKSVPTPLMQVVRNRFATTGSAFDLDWLGKEHR